MSELPERLYSAEHTRQLDQVAIKSRKIPGFTLMQRAGAAVFQTLRAYWPGAQRIAVVCGPGNNGGDGFIIGQLARQAGMTVDLFLAGEVKKLKGDAAKAATAFEETGGKVIASGKFPDGDCDVVVDALLGTGLQRGVEGEFARLINTINDMPAGRLAVDIPSGLSADSGAILGVAIRADATVTFIGLKQGLLTGRGPECTGQLLFDDLEVPADIYDEVTCDARRVTQEWVAGRLPPRERCAHKGHFGHVLCLGGDYGMGGAIRLCAEAAVRSGAGLVSAGTRPEHVPAVIAGCPMVMARGVSDEADLDALLERASVVAVGPGLGRSEWGQQLLNKALASGLPLVVDADALNLLADSRDKAGKKNPWVLTPHPGEAARLLDSDTAAVQADRFAAAAEIARRYNAVCVLKGCGSIISDGISDGAAGTWLCHQGNPGMASGGMGDVLTGAIAALRAQGLDALDAAVCGTWMHAEAADRAAVDGERGLAASDLFVHLRMVANPNA